MGPAKIIDGDDRAICGTSGFWVGIILVYYISFYLLPIDKMISKLYPLFGYGHVLRAVGLLIALFFGD